MGLIYAYPVMQIRPYGLLVYEHKEFDSNPRRSENTHKRELIQYTGRLTPFSKKKLKRSIGLMVATALEKEAPNFKTGNTFKFKVNFLTFTLPAAQEGIEDKKIKHCLDNFIKRAKRKYQLHSYVWRAERQANGNVHFHMITDTYIHYQKLRDDWNACLRETGLIDKYKKKHEQLTLSDYLKLYPPTKNISREARVNAYKAGRATHWESPNSTDVHAVWKVKNLTSYFVKYMSKEHKEGEAPIQGKIWDCSTNLKTKNNCELVLEGETRVKWEELIHDESLQFIQDPLFTIIFIPPDRFILLFTPHMLQRWNEYLEVIRNST